MTIVETPPQPPSQAELEALIEEARRRARRRRLVVAGAVVGALAVAGIVAGLMWPKGDGSRGEGLRKGFHAVQARGHVQHALVEELRPRLTTITLATGRARTTHVTREIWWDPRSGLYRILVRDDGVAMADWVQQTCLGSGSRHGCLAPSPFDLRSQGVVWQPKPDRARRVAVGTFRGEPVVWVEELMGPANGRQALSGNQVAFDAATHQLVALRQIIRAPPPSSARSSVFAESAVRMLPDLAPKQAPFAVPDGGAPYNFDMFVGASQSATLAGAAGLLGRRALWLGQTYRRNRLRSVVGGSQGSENARRGGAGVAPVLTLDYGAFTIDEYGVTRPLWLLNAPRHGTLLRELDSSFVYGRDGIVVKVTPAGRRRWGRSELVALARALRPAA
jgi:hypothetical protein